MRFLFLLLAVLLFPFGGAFAQQCAGSGCVEYFTTGSITPAATAAAIGTSQQTFTVTGLTTGMDVWVVGPAPTALCPNTGARVSAANTLQLDFATMTAVACTPAAGTYNVIARIR